MRIAQLCLAASIVAASGISAAAVEMVKPFEVLEGARRDRIELDKRMKREAAEQRRREKEQKAQQEAQRKRDAAAAKEAQRAHPSSATTVPSQPTTTPASPSGSAPE